MGQFLVLHLGMLGAFLSVTISSPISLVILDCGLGYPQFPQNLALFTCIAIVVV